MNYPELIAKLCAIIDQQNEIIQEQAMTLGQLDALDRAEEIGRLLRDYADATGASGEVAAK